MTASRSTGPARAAAAVAAALGFATLFLAAPALGASFEVLGVTDQDVRPLAHFTVYGSLALALAYALGGRLGWAWALAALLATAEELHQLAVPGRWADPADWAVNLAAITFALLAAHLWAARRACADPRPAPGQPAAA